tara:strand:- start:127 stop:492 length:366 start_codon:yes stop_codon:yes gene_type:complete
MYYVTLDQDHRNILKCYSGKRFKFHCWCEDKDDWKEMEYFNATRIARVRIDITSEPNWWRVAEKRVSVLKDGVSYEVVGVHDTGTYIKLWLLNELLDITLETSAMYCVIDFIRAGLEIKKD